MTLRAENISKSFGGLKALNQVSLDVRAGEVFGLIGPNGAGKTTLLNVITGVHRPDAGRLYFMEENVTGLDPEVLCQRGISRTFQTPQSFARLTVYESVLVAAMFGRRRVEAGEAEKRAREALDFVGFPEPFDLFAASLNTVQLKRLDLARALASRPKLLVLDEIAAGLAPHELRDLVRLLGSIRQTGAALIVVEHLMRVIGEVCDRVAFLQSGEKLAEATPAEIANDARVINAYLGDGRLEDG